MRWDLTLVQLDPQQSPTLVNVGYSIQILDAEGREILAYHWHPESVSPIDYPHMHLTSRVSVIDAPGIGRPIALGDTHISTGVVALAHVARMLIEEFDVEPLRADWQAVLILD